MKKLILLLLFAAISRLGSAQALYFTFDSIANPPYICQAHVFNVEVFGMVSGGSVQTGSQQYVVSNDTIYVQFHFIPGSGPAMPYPLHRQMVIPAPNLGQFKIVAQGFYNGQLHKTITSTISICAPIQTATGKEKAKTVFTVFPNPTQDFVKIIAPENRYDLTLKITDATGKKVHSEVMPAGVRQNQINLSSMPAGLYFLQIISSEGNFTQKIVKH